ncbi:hypothetical protein Lal_00043657, partial [Lupinus albus]
MARVCGICTSTDHYSDVCPYLLEPRTTNHPEAYAANIYNNRPNQQQQNYYPSSRRYNPGWRNHPNLKFRPYVPLPIQQQRQHQVINNPPPGPSEPSLEELVRKMTMQNIQESSIQNPTTQMGKMATSLNTLQSHNSDKLPSQTVINPKNVNFITLRPGKQTELPTSTPDSALQK